MLSQRPNILFLMSDEHRADVTGYEGNSVIRTPVLDRLAQEGVVFSNAYTPSPICVPGRQSMATGQFPLHCNCQRYGEDLAPGYMTFARRFSQYAYNTVACGKLHHSGADQMQGWTRRVAGDLNVGAELIDGRVEKELDLYKGNTQGQKWSDAKEIQRAGVGRRSDRRDAFTVHGALDYIEEYFCDPYYDRAQAERPLMLKISLTQPHYPYFTDEERFSYYLNRVPVYTDQIVSDHPFLGERAVRPDVDVSRRELRRATAAYYGMIDNLDGLFGQVITALETVGQDLDDWIIVYTSDHGEMLGEHGVWEKRKFYEASARVPLIIRWPNGFQGDRVVTENVNLCDLFATLCDLAEIPTPGGLDSRSLVPLLRGTSDPWDNETISQFDGKNLMIKQDHLKYQFYGASMPEVLFDLEADPGETTNCIDDPAYGQALLQFRRRREQLGFSLTDEAAK